MRRMFRRIHFLLNRRRLEQELEDEMAAHREMMAAERRGAFGNSLQLREEIRDVWGWRRLEQLARDIGYGMRQVRRNPAFSAIAIGTLALGIGGITAMFSAFETILIRPLPYADPDRLVMVWDSLSRERIGKSSPTPAEWLEWRRQNTFSPTSRPCNRRKPRSPAMRSPNRSPRARRRETFGAFWV